VRSYASRPSGPSRSWAAMSFPRSHRCRFLVLGSRFCRAAA
jgi:hypothetical protein